MAQIRNVKAASLDLVGRDYLETVRVDTVSKQFIKENAPSIYLDSHNDTWVFDNRYHTGEKTTLARAIFKSCTKKTPKGRVRFKNENNRDFRFTNLFV